MMALISVEDADLLPILGSRRLGSLLMMFCRTGMRNARVFPVPVRAWARLGHY